jgi:hypothetical protein
LTSAGFHVPVLFLVDPTPSPEPSCACRAGEVTRIARQLARLEELAEIGMDLARQVRREALAEPREDGPPARPVADLALVFSRISRAVRQTLALEARLAADHQAELAAGRHILREAAHALQTRLVRDQKRAQVRVIAAEAIEAEIHEDCRAQVLAEMDERLDAYDDLERDDLERRPVGALVAEICRALGVPVDWSLWEQEEWACQEGETRAPGSPYAWHRVTPRPPPDLPLAGAFADAPAPEHPPP